MLKKHFTHDTNTILQTSITGTAIKSENVLENESKRNFTVVLILSIYTSVFNTEIITVVKKI
jgi:hypothetical protein